jgi:hypothetical protein
MKSVAPASTASLPMKSAEPSSSLTQIMSEDGTVTCPAASARLCPALMRTTCFGEGLSVSLRFHARIQREMTLRPAGCSWRRSLSTGTTSVSGVGTAMMWPSGRRPVPSTTPPASTRSTG